MKTKVCTKCGESKPLSEYHKHKAGRFGLAAVCDKCIAAKDRKYREENKEKVAAVHKKYYEANKEKIAAQKKKYGEENKDKIAAKSAKHRAIKASLPGHYTAAEFTAICKKYNNRCLCCGKKRKLTADHVVPITWKGSTNYISNIQPLCGPCNSGKCNNHATDYRINYTAAKAERSP